jgi:hypothetical protein
VKERELGATCARPIPSHLLDSERLLESDNCTARPKRIRFHKAAEQLICDRVAHLKLHAVSTGTVDGIRRRAVDTGAVDRRCPPLRLSSASGLAAAVAIDQTRVGVLYPWFLHSSALHRGNIILEVALLGSDDWCLQHQRASRLNLSSVDYCCRPTSTWFAGVRSPAALVAHLRLCSQGYCFCGGILSTHG